MQTVNRKNSRHLLLTAALLCSTASLAIAQDPVSPDAAAPPATVSQPSTDQRPASQPEIDELRRRIDILADEVEKLRSAEADTIEISEERRRALGLAPSAAATYRRATGGVSLAGYGEMLVENFAAENESGAGGAPTTRMDFLRAILYAGYRFDEKFLFNSEIEIEHAGEIFVEFAYVDYVFNDNLSMRGGLLLLPLGLTNEFHEPTVFIGSRRPETEQRILPSTWRENGAGLIGSFGRVNFRAYVVNGLNASGFTSAGLRGGRQRGIQARAANLAFAGRLDVTPLPGIFAGVGFYNGGSGQDAIVVNGERLDIGNTVGEVHAQLQLRGFDVRGLFARATVNDAGPLSAALKLPTTAPVAEQMEGGYVQLGYNVLSQIPSTLSVMPYVRVEHVDTQRRVPDGFTRDLARDGMFRTLGVELKPISNIVLKTEYQWIANEAGTGRNQFNVNLGYSF
jgi:opacity protein-like surface antigen